MEVWGSLLAPFVADVSSLIGQMWSKLSLEEQALVVLGLFVLYGGYQTYKAVQKRADAIMFVLFQVSYLVVGPCIYLGWRCIPPSYSQPLVTVVLTVIPTCMSVLAFNRAQSAKRVKMWERWLACDLWLSYWSCWPMLSLLFYMITTYTRDDAMKLQVLSVFVALCVWLQLWYGSKAFFSLVSRAFSSITPHEASASAVLPGAGRVFSAIRSTLSFSQQMSIIETLQELWKNKMWSVPLLVVVVAVLVQLGWRIYSLFNDALTALIWVGVAFKSSQVVKRKESVRYAESLAFWVLAQFTQVALHIPVVGTFIALFRPVLLPVYLAIGDNVLGTVVAALSGFINTIVPVSGVVVAVMLCNGGT